MGPALATNLTNILAHQLMQIATIDPATGQTLETFAPHDAEAVELRLGLAATAFDAWRRRPVAERAAVVARAGDILERERERFGTLMTSEMGKPLAAAIAEAEKCALACRFYAECGERMLAPEAVAIEGEESYVAFEPLGVVLAIMPWNFPFWQVIRFAAPTLVAGNVGLLKHASSVPRCALALEEIFRQAGAPRGVFQTLLVGADVVERVLADSRVAAATLTGSERAGAAVGSTAARHIKKTVLELGGSDPFIVMPSADLDRAVDTAVTARTINNGQSCIAAKRFIVHDAIAPEFERRFVERMRALRVGHPADPRTDVGPLASEQILEELDAQVRGTIEKGARLLTGGERLDQPGYYYAPTVLADIPPDAPAYHEELFGPVASLFRAPGIDDAIAIANDTTFGLGASAWTNVRSEADRFARELASGMVFINEMVASDPRFPFGGVKSSGYGRELGEYGLREFVNIKTVRMKLAGGAAPGGTLTE